MRDDDAAGPPNAGIGVQSRSGASWASGAEH
jgi:hypothetical protein